MSEHLIDILPLLRDVLGSAVEIQEYQIAKQQTDYLVLIATLRNPAMKVVIKLAGPDSSRPCTFNRSAALYKIISEQTSLKMPTILATDESYQKWAWRYSIFTWMPGQDFSTLYGRLKSVELRKVNGQIGAAVADLHNIRFPTYGEFCSDGIIQPFPTYREAILDRATRYIHSSRMRDFFLHALDRNARYFDGLSDARLTHEDLHPYNLLFDRVGNEWRLSTIMDFDKAWAGSAESDLARMELWHMTGVGFWQTYNAHHTLDSLYPYRRPIYQLFWCLEYADPTPEHLETTRQVCLELGLPTIQKFEPFVVRR